MEKGHFGIMVKKIIGKDIITQTPIEWLFNICWIVLIVGSKKGKFNPTAGFVPF